MLYLATAEVPQRGSAMRWRSKNGDGTIRIRPYDYVITSCKRLKDGREVLQGKNVALPIEVNGTTVTLDFAHATGDIRDVHLRSFDEEKERGRPPAHEGIARILNLAVQSGTPRAIGFEIADGNQVKVVLAARERPKVIPQNILNASW